MRDSQTRATLSNPRPRTRNEMRSAVLESARRLFSDLWEDKTQREIVLESLKADCEDGTASAYLSKSTQV